MDVKEASQVVSSATGHDYGNFYGGELGEQTLGVGQIFNNIRYPIFNFEDQVFDTVEGLVYILSHECDISTENVRPYNDYALVCPIISLEACVEHLSKSLSNEELSSFLARLGRDEISRVSYFPPIAGCFLNGGIMYLNQVTHTHVSTFKIKGVEGVTSLTANGLRIIDYKVVNHLLRPKATNLSLMRY